MEATIDYNKGISVIRNYPGGSNATTILCTDGLRTFYRKYAKGRDAEKLWQQILWIEENEGSVALPRIIEKERTDGYCFYDMEYVNHSVGLVEYAHSASVDQTWEILKKVINDLNSSLYGTGLAKADTETVHRYYVEKVSKNIQIIRSSPLFKTLMTYDKLIINGKVYNNLPYYERFLSEDNLQRIFGQDVYSIIHGDLTVENIICTRDERGMEGVYLIDPNTGNIHNSPNLDFAKLLQSLHGEYEFIKKASNVIVDNDEVRFQYTQSTVFKKLCQRFNGYLYEIFDRDTVRSIYYHEVVHWLRLMPYKLTNDSYRALAFFAKMLVVMDEIKQMFDDGKE